LFSTAAVLTTNVEEKVSSPLSVVPTRWILPSLAAMPVGKLFPPPTTLSHLLSAVVASTAKTNVDRGKDMEVAELMCCSLCAAACAPKEKVIGAV
jgi:hypothetical protein